MDTDKSIVMRAFNKLFFEFIEDIISIYPDNVDMLTARESFSTFKKLNPTSIIKVWFSGIYSKYKPQIDVGDIMFFTEKDYSADLTKVNNMQNVLDMIDNVREPIKNMSIQNKEHVTKYIQDLSKLSTAYAALTSTVSVSVSGI
jgi:hypothetical protein